MTTPILLALGLLALLAITALLIAASALSQTRALWTKITAHENQVRKSVSELYNINRRCNATCSRLLLDINGGIERIAGWVEAQDPDFAKRRAAAIKSAHSESRSPEGSPWGAQDGVRP